MAQAHAEGIAALLRREGDTAALYDDAAHLIGPGERSWYGQAEIAEFWRGLASSFRVTQCSIEHLVLQQDAARSGRPDRIALRLRAQSVHEPMTLDDQRFGKGTGRPVELLGIVHAELLRGRVLRQWVLLDEVALWMQILRRQQLRPDGPHHGTHPAQEHRQVLGHIRRRQAACRSTSPTASSWCCWGHPAAARPPRCAWWQGWKTRPPARSGSGSAA
jgi:hypothetical protein